MAFERTQMGRTLKVSAAALALTGLLASGGCAARSLNPFADRAAEPVQESGTMIGVNAYLWRASLDTLSFMPLASADPYGGLIITDWYSNPEQPTERFKATVYILDTRLRADGLNVAINRQVRSGADWVEAPAAADTEDQIENAILVRARQIRISGR